MMDGLVAPLSCAHREAGYYCPREIPEGRTGTGRGRTQGADSGKVDGLRSLRSLDFFRWRRLGACFPPKTSISFCGICMVLHWKEGQVSSKGREREKSGRGEGTGGHRIDGNGWRRSDSVKYLEFTQNGNASFILPFRKNSFLCAQEFL